MLSREEKKKSNNFFRYCCSSQPSSNSQTYLEFRRRFLQVLDLLPCIDRRSALRQHGRRAKPGQRKGAKGVAEVLLPGRDSLVGAGGVQDDSISPRGGGKGGGDEEGRRLEGKRREQQEAGLHGLGGGRLCVYKGWCV